MIGDLQGEAGARLQNTPRPARPAPPGPAAHRQLQEALDNAGVIHILQRQSSAGPAPGRRAPRPGGTPPLTLKGFMEFWMVGTIHCRGGHSVSSLARERTRPSHHRCPAPSTCWINPTCS